jgi:hypothetical protein
MRQDCIVIPWSFNPISILSSDANDDDDDNNNGNGVGSRTKPVHTRRFEKQNVGL